MPSRSLGIFTIENGWDRKQVPADSTAYHIIDAGLDLGLCIHETEKGQAALVDVAKKLIVGWTENGQAHLYKYPLEDLPRWIQHVLHSLRNEFPDIVLDPDEDREASTDRAFWGVDMEQYRPKLAGSIAVHSVLIDNMRLAHTRNMPDYYVFKLQLGLVLAHEIVHLLTGFLNSDPMTLSPPQVRVDGYSPKTEGEAGRWWEQKFIGGQIEFWAPDRGPSDRRMSRDPYIFEKAKKDGRGYQLPKEFITSFRNKGLVFDFPVQIPRNQPVVTRASLAERGMQETSKFRKSHMMSREMAVNSPGPQHLSRRVAYRRVPSSQ